MKKIQTGFCRGNQYKKSVTLNVFKRGVPTAFIFSVNVHCITQMVLSTAKSCLKVLALVFPFDRELFRANERGVGH